MYPWKAFKILRRVIPTSPKEYVSQIPLFYIFTLLPPSTLSVDIIVVATFSDLLDSKFLSHVIHTLQFFKMYMFFSFILAITTRISSPTYASDSLFQTHFPNWCSIFPRTCVAFSHSCHIHIAHFEHC